MTRLLAPDEAGLSEAASLLRAGRLVAFGTETVYGLGADATQGQAVAAVFTAKGRPHFNPLICHYPDATAAFRHVHADARAAALAAAFWPGPLTLVLKRRVSCPVALLVSAGLDTLAVRVPGLASARRLLKLAGVPVAAPSANQSGGVSPTRAAHVMDDLGGRIDAVVDTGPCLVGLESTVLDMSGAFPVLLRAGGVSIEAIRAVVGAVECGPTPAQTEVTGRLHSPGMLVSHYAPSLHVRLGAGQASAHEALLAFGPKPPPAVLVWNLSDSGDLKEAAARLFQGLRFLDAEGPQRGLSGIAAMEVPDHGLGLAINDRLQRAAAPRA